MKRIIYFISILLLTASCFGDEPTYQRSFSLVADFEYSFDYEETFGPDSLWFDSVTGAGVGYMDLAFFHKLNDEKTDVLGGFMVSYQEMPKKVEDKKEDGGDTEDGSDLEEPEVVEVDKTCRAYLLKPLSNRNTYLVFRDSDHMPEHDVEFINAPYGTCIMESCYITNTLEVAEAVAATFEKGDKLVVRATGYKDGMKTGTAEAALAEFSSQKDSIVSSWTRFNLSTLGAVNFVEFEMEVQSEKGAGKVPTNFCLDNMNASINISY